MGGREEDVARGWIDERTGGLADTRRDTGRIPGLHVHEVNLVKRIAGLALALKDELAAVGRPVAFASATAFDRQPADARQELALAGGSLRRYRRVGPGHRRRSGHRACKNQQSEPASKLKSHRRDLFYAAVSASNAFPS